MIEEAERKAALKRQSDDYMRLAREKAAVGLDREAAAAAYEAGYFALMTALTAAEVRCLSDHPSAEAAELAAKRLGLAEHERKLAVEGATAFYTESREVFASHDWLAWMSLVKNAFAWNS